jgi:hypothetical protein
VRHKVANKSRRHRIPGPFATEAVKARFRPGVSVLAVKFVNLEYKMVASHAYGGNNLKKVKLVSSGRETLYPLSNRDVAFVVSVTRSTIGFLL